MKENPNDWKNDLKGVRVDSIDDSTLDRLLEVDAQLQVQKIVKEVPEETVSLQWRSSLNEKLIALAPAKKPSIRFGFAVRALAGFAVAGLLCVAFFGSRKPQTSAHESAQVSAGALASALISAHRQTVVSNEIGGLGEADADADRAVDSNWQTDSDSDSDPL